MLTFRLSSFRRLHSPLLAAVILITLVSTGPLSSGADDTQDWFPFAPKPDAFEAKSGFDLHTQ